MVRRILDMGLADSRALWVRWETCRSLDRIFVSTICTRGIALIAAGICGALHMLEKSLVVAQVWFFDYYLP